MIRKVNQIGINGSWSHSGPLSRHSFPISNVETFSLLEFNSVSFFSIGNLGWSIMWRLCGGLTHGTNYKVARSKVFNIPTSYNNYF
jgi:hypothetical protein